MIVELLTFGNELLDGRRIDTNTSWIGRFLSDLGLEVRYRQTTQDRKEDISSAFRTALDRSDLIISTGGLGPTLDDITFESLAQALQLPLKFHSDIFLEIEKKYALRGIPCPPSNRRQAMLPEGSVPIPAVGTAPGCFVSLKGKMIFCFPGVPFEMKSMMKSFFMEVIQKKITFRPVTQIGYTISGIAEARVEEIIQEQGLDRFDKTDISIAYTASESQVDVTYSVTPHEIKDKEQILADIHQKFFKTFYGNLARWDGKTIEEHLVHWFLEKKWKLGIAESITGGLITSKIVNVPGCSEVLDRGVVTYSYASKMDILDVQKTTLEMNGAVSSECVLEMARGLKRKANVDIAISICGIAGPGGATEKKPVGLVYICWVGPTPISEEYVKCTNFEKKVGPTTQNADMNINRNQKIVEEQFFEDENGFAKVQGIVFSGDRKRNRILATNQALMGLHAFLQRYEDRKQN